MSNNTYFLANVQGRRDLTEAISALVTMMGNEKDYLATRVSYKLDLRGPKHQRPDSLLDVPCSGVSGVPEPDDLPV